MKMNAGWDRKQLGELLQKTETVNPLTRPDREFEYIDVSSVSNETFQIESTQRLLGRNAPSRARRLVKSNDILFATVRPTLRRIAIIPPELDGHVCSTGYFVLRSKPDLDHRYLFYSLFTDSFLDAMENLQRGTSYPAVTDGDVRAQEISFPPPAEQRRIVGILDEAFAGIATAKANAEKNLQNARALFESHLDAVFTQSGDGWVNEQLSDLVDADCTLSYGIVQPGKEYPDGLPVVRPTDLATKLVELNSLKRIDPKFAKAYQRTTLKGGELLLCVRGSTGVASVASRELKGANVTRGIVPVRFRESRIVPAFGYYAMVSGHVQQQIRSKTRGAALMQINIGDLRKVIVRHPKVNKQRDIVSICDALVEATQRLEAIYQRKLDLLDALKKSLLHQAFSGQL